MSKIEMSNNIVFKPLLSELTATAVAKIKGCRDDSPLFVI